MRRQTTVHLFYMLSCALCPVPPRWWNCLRSALFVVFVITVDL